MPALNQTATQPQAPPAAIQADGRLDFVDNLRWVMIVLVVSMHAAVTYSHLGSWYYMEDPKPQLWETVLFAYYQMGLQAFFMGLLFFFGGYFVPGALVRKGPVTFLRDRFTRLVLPTLLYMLLIHPLIVYWLLREYRQIAGPFPTLYWQYIRSFRFLGSSGPMWFALALFIFSLIPTIFYKARHIQAPMPPETSLPTNRQVIGLILLMALCTFLVRVSWPIGTNILNMQLCFFSQYILLFALGLLAWRRNWLRRIPYLFGMRWFWLAISVGTLFWLALIVSAVLTHNEQALFGGATWKSAALSLWESFFCLGICLGLIVLFREKFNHKGTFAQVLADNSFSVYLFHAPLLIAVTLALHPLAVPKIPKFLLATVLGTVISFSASHWIFRRVPLLKRIL